MTPSPFIDLVIGLFPWGFIKIGILLLLLMYFIFAAVIVRQVQLMSKVIEVQSSPALHILANSHLIFAAVAFFFSLILL